MNGQQRIRLQIAAEIREIIADVDKLKMCYTLSCIEILTPRAEVILRSGKKSKIPLKLCYHNVMPRYGIILQYPLQYPYEPLEILEIKQEGIHGITDDDNTQEEESLVNINEERKQEIISLGQEFSKSSIGENGYSLELIKYLRSLLEPSLEKSEPANNSQPPQEIPKPYKCRQCRHILFYSSHIEHNPIHEKSSKCTSIFLQELPAEGEIINHVEEAVHWLRDIYSSPSTDGISGKILCPSCQSKVGYWSWSGAQCSCGVWFVPSLQFTVAKIDPPITLSAKNISIAVPSQNMKVSLPVPETFLSETKECAEAT